MPVGHQQGPPRQQRQHRAQLLHTDGGGGGAARHALVVQHVGPAARRRGQGHQRGAGPPGQHRLHARGRVRGVDERAVGEGRGLRAMDRARVEAEQQPLTRGGTRQVAREEPPQRGAVDPPVGERGVEARPAALGARCLRQLDERPGLRGGQQGVRDFEERIGGTGEGGVQLLAVGRERGSIHPGPSCGISTRKYTRGAGCLSAGPNSLNITMISVQ